MENIAILIPFVGMSIPIVAIVLSYRHKSEKMRLDATARDSAERPRSTLPATWSWRTGCGCSNGS
jgi:hypothetical protein